MPKHPELSRLPKALALHRSINFKRTTPGSINKLSHTTRRPRPETALDPAHPVFSLDAGEYADAVRWHRVPGLRLRALPKGVLGLPTEGPAQAYPDANEHPRPGQVNMSIQNVSPTGIGGRVVRNKMYTKIKMAIALIVTRGAAAEKDLRGQERIVFREWETGGDRWIMPDWTYAVQPEPEVYRMPLPQLITSLRRALRYIKKGATPLQEKCTEMEQQLRVASGEAVNEDAQPKAILPSTGEKVRPMSPDPSPHGLVPQPKS